MTSKPRTAPLRSRAPRAALGGGLVAAVLLASGCQAHVGTAADVAGTRISTASLNDAVKAVQGTALASRAGNNLQRQMLSDLVLQQEVETLARRHKVSATAGEIAAQTARLKAASAAAGNPAEPDAYWQPQGRETAQVIAAMRALNQQTGRYDAVNLYLVPVKNQGEGETVLGLLAKTPSAKASIAQQYSSDAGLKKTGGEVGIVTLAQLNVPAATKMKKGDATIASVQGQPAVLVVEDRLDAADFSRELTQDVSVKLNPRFGVWDPTSSTGTYVVPATNTLSKADPSKAPADTPTPAASGAASAPAGAPASSAPAASAPAPAPSS